ncbi:unnamed protein product, partial [Rotaria sp. Silwood2]
ALRLIEAEFRRLADIDIDLSDCIPVHSIVYRPNEFMMAEKTVAALLSKTLEQIPKYSGKPDQDADEWIKELTTTFRMADINESQAIKIIPTFFEGPAKQWFLENSISFESWSAFKAEFIHTYSSPALKQLASHRLRTRHQRIDEPVIEYYTDIMKLCKIVDPNMTDMSKIDHLYHGLKSALMKEVLRQAPRTPSDFLEHARQEETLDRLVTTSVNHTDHDNAGTYASHNTFYPHMVVDDTAHFNNPSNTYSKNHSNNAYSPRSSYSKSYYQPSPHYPSQPQLPPFNALNHQPRSLRCYQCNKLGHIARNYFILGGDWCTQNAAQINYDTNQVSIRSSTGRIIIPYDKSIDHLTLDVKLITSIKIPPRESCTVQAKVELSSADTVYFHPDTDAQHEQSILLSPSLLRIENYTTYLEIYNPHDYITTLPMNTRLGRITHVPYQVISFQLPDAVNYLSSSSHSVINSIEPQPISFPPRANIENLIDHIIDPQEKNQIRIILEQHMKVFDTSHVTQANTPIQHTINIGDSLPISSRLYSRTIQQRSDLQNEIHQMLQANQIRPSNSPWSSPVIIHKKKDGGIRFLVDYRKLNAVTKKDSFPQPTTEELLNRLGGRKFYTKLDLKSGYFQIPIHEADKEKTAFITQDGFWEFNVLPQGIMNGPPTFQRIMHNLLDKANFQVNSDKCFIAVREINFLSHTINEQLIKPNGEKIKAITDLPAPTTLNEANEFLGKINWYRKFIPNFARIAAPLHKVTNKTKARRHEFTWGPEQQAAFNEFKHILTTYPLFLEYPDLSTPFILTTDASDIGIGGILRQDTPHGTKINYFKSRVLNDTEHKYDTFEKEALAIYWCLTELRSYIGDSDIIVETDHKPLENFHKKQINNKRVMNWLFKLQDILPQIVAVKYRKGANNTAADYISRHFPSSVMINDSTIIVQETDDWPIGTESWSEDLAKPQRSDFATPFINTHNLKINAVTTRAQAKLLAQPIPPTSTHPSITTQQSSTSSLTSANLPYDFSLSRIRFEQEHDPVIRTIIQNIHNKQDNSTFILKNDVLYKLVSRG